ncbi:MAG: hemolysin III family protein [Lachnospiraceae bacterium]
MTDVTVRSRLSRVSLPTYSLSEELINAISHGIGAALGIAGLILCVIKSVSEADPWGIVAGSVFGASLILLYAMSSLYHSIRPNNVKRAFRVVDHCTIFVLIAGTYTPFTLMTLRANVGWPLFGIIWGAAAIGIVLNAIDVEKFKKVSMACYLAMGWCILLAFRPLAQAMEPVGLQLLMWGGIAYTIGAVIYGIGSKVKYMHSIWHFFVLAGSILHFFCIYLYVL